MRTIPSLRSPPNLPAPDGGGKTPPQTLTYDFVDARKHISRLFYNNIPHILAYGVHARVAVEPDLHNEQTSQIGLWRYGVKFNIYLNGEDVKYNESFYEKCVPLWKIDWRTAAADKTKWHDGRAQIFDLMVSECLPLLEKLAPEPKGGYWRTVGDCLHCPNYELKIVADAKTKELRVEQSITPALGHTMEVFRDYSPKPLPSLWLGEKSPDGIPEYSTFDLTFEESDMLNNEKCHFETPRKVKLPDGRLCYFLHGDSESEWFEENEFRDESLNTIRAYFEVERAAQKSQHAYPQGLMKMVGVVVDTGASRMRQNQQPKAEKEPVTWIAGILLPWLPDLRSLRSLIESQASTSPSHSQDMQKWHRQILETITSLHELGIAIGAEDISYADDPFSFVNEHTILIDGHGEGDAYLKLEDPVFEVRSFDGQSYPKYAALDLEALGKVFPGCSEEDKKAKQARL